MSYIKRPIYKTNNKLSWVTPTFEGEDVEFMKENDMPMYSGIDVYKTIKREKDTFLIGSLDNDIDSIDDSGNINRFYFYRSGSFYKEFEDADSILNDDAISKGYRIGDKYSYRVIPSPFVSFETDKFGRRIFLSDIKVNNNDSDPGEFIVPRKVDIDGYIVSYDKINKTYTTKIYFQPLNGGGIGPVQLGQEKFKGYYEISSSINGIENIDQTTLYSSYSNPSRFGTDLLLVNQDFNRKVDLQSHELSFISGSQNINSIDIKITPVDFKKNKGEITSISTRLRTMKRVAPVYSQTSYDGQGIPTSNIFKWVLEGDGEASSHVEIYRGITKRGSEDNLVLNSLGIFNVDSEQVPFPDESSGVIRTVYEYIDEDIEEFLNDSDVFIAKYAFRLIHSEDATKQDDKQISDFQINVTGYIGSRVPSLVSNMTLILQKRTVQDFSDYVDFPGLTAQEVRERQQQVIITNQEFQIEAINSDERDVTVVIYEPESGLYTEKTYNLKEIK